MTRLLKVEIKKLHILQINDGLFHLDSNNLILTTLNIYFLVISYSFNFKDFKFITNIFQFQCIS